MTKDCLLLGLGQIGMGYDLFLDKRYIFTHSRAITSHPDFNLVAAIDPSAELRDQFTKSYNIPAYESVKGSLVQSSPSIVIIATPSQTHGKVIDELLEHITPEIILCEKPLDYDFETAKHIIKRCKEKKIKLYVNYMRRSEPGALMVKEKISSLVIQPPIKGFVWYTKGLMNSGSHFLNILELWLGDVKDVNTLSRGELWNELDQDYDFIVKFDLGEVIFSSGREASNTYNSIELMSPAGRLFYENGGETISWHPIISDPLLENYKKISDQPEIIDNKMEQYQYNVYQEISNAMKGKDYNLSHADDALRTLQHIYKIGD